MAEDHGWGGVARLAREQPKLVDWVRDEVRSAGPLTAAELEADAPRRTGNWGWNWSAAKIALEWLFWRGEVLVAGRNGSFARLYDIPERVLPAAVLDAPTPAPADAFRELVRIAAGALGVATEAELRDYFRLPVAGARTAVGELVEAGELVAVEVAGWRQPAYLHPAARLPRWIRASTLVSPFDPVVWQRERTERLFDFSYRIEIYTPAAQRVLRLLRAAVPARRPAGRPGRPQGRPDRRGAAGPGGLEGAGTPRPRRPRRWPPSCAGWPAGWAWHRSPPPSVATCPPPLRCRRAVRAIAV